MCDYCSCRTMPVIDELGADHDALLDLADRIRGSVHGDDLRAARSALGELPALLRSHTAVEEASVLAALRAAGGVDEHVDALEADHARAWAAVAALDSCDWSSAVFELLDDLAEHIRREEYDVFPAALVCIPTAAWDEVARAAQRVGRCVE